MAENSKIEWTDHTFNPWIGCTKVSPGCANCYAEAQDGRWKYTEGGWGPGKPRKRTSEANWKKPLKWNRDAHLAYEKGSNVRPRVFCASLADWLDDEVPFEWLADLLNLIYETPYLDWLLLTKRPQNFMKQVDEAWLYCRNNSIRCLFEEWTAPKYHPDNIWVGTSAEDQQRWDERVPALLHIPAKIHFVSAEPLLGSIVMGKRQPDWLIVGGESGPKARPMKEQWVKSLQQQAQCSNTAFFFKQWGGVNKSKTGRELDGQTWSQLPKTT